MKKLIVLPGTFLMLFMFNSCFSTQARYPNMKKQIRISKRSYVVWVEDTANSELHYQAAWSVAIGKVLRTAKIIPPPIANRRPDTTRDLYDEAKASRGKLRIKNFDFFPYVLKAARRVLPRTKYIIFISAEDTGSLIPEMVNVTFTAVIWNLRRQRMEVGYSVVKTFIAKAVGVQKTLFAAELVHTLMKGERAPEIKKRARKIAKLARQKKRRLNSKKRQRDRKRKKNRRKKA